MNLGLSEHSLADRIGHPDEAFPVSDTHSDRFARVALDVPLAQLGASLFDYRVPAEMAAAVLERKPQFIRSRADAPAHI